VTRPYVKLLKKEDDFKIYLVDGRWVREHRYIDFTQGGHGYRYNFIPKDEIWIDDALSPDERPFALEHELDEAPHMRDGMDYSRAHGFANIKEKKMRGASYGAWAKEKNPTRG
jgi:hypothetical protein